MTSSSSSPSSDAPPASSRTQASNPRPQRLTSPGARPPPRPHAHPVAAAPATRTCFDPWNSSSTGHQRAENRLSGSTSWRASRSLKLSEQYRSGLGGGRRVADTVGAGSEGFGKDGRKENGGWERGAVGLRTGGQKSLVEVWGKSKAHLEAGRSEKLREANDDVHVKGPSTECDGLQGGEPERQIFDGLCFYLNGSTAPLVSDHKLKRLVAERGGRMSIALGRHSVTHVILGTTSGQGGCGGGLAGSKIQKEIAKIGGKSVKFVTAEWILESIKAGRRIPESRFSTLKLAAPRQNSVLGMFKQDANG
ncbi:hypothetical protein K491DRAFT_605133 [Lophiostoma macrostomum CBS 122681]|uniref:BRCT domain-containing protein n=1 Tax=Lophiostoma macrostomum CBS 122681 TaxID=1314788 RepID=A0A6A6SX47_9PLEO|nr:hypothetical protein K491DRAFT_605133 [Lophiostoma macrostomum CBS 122681]